MLGSNQVNLNAMMAFEVQLDLILARGALQNLFVNKLY
tara:strand:- start:1174 stop:1287 length:114 start_codon:yes stop_codon:yes gene_type:complete